MQKKLEAEDFNKMTDETLIAKLDEAGDAIDAFVAENVSCGTCCFSQNTFPCGIICHPLGGEAFHLDSDTSMCECHEFSDYNLQEQLDKLGEVYTNLYEIYFQRFIKDKRRIGYRVFV